MRFEIWHKAPDGKRLSRERYIEIPFSGYFTEVFEGPHLLGRNHYWRDIALEEEDHVRAHLGIAKSAILFRLSSSWAGVDGYYPNRCNPMSLRIFQYMDVAPDATWQFKFVLPPMHFLKNLTHFKGRRGSGGHLYTGCLYTVPGCMSLRGILLNTHTNREHARFGLRAVDYVPIDQAQLTHAEQVKLDQLLDRGLA